MAKVAKIGTVYWLDSPRPEFRRADFEKKVLLQGVDAGIVCLPVHDAVAVQRRHVDWAVEAMTNAWAEIAYGLRPKIKVE